MVAGGSVHSAIDTQPAAARARSLRPGPSPYPHTHSPSTLTPREKMNSARPTIRKHRTLPVRVGSGGGGSAESWAMCVTCNREPPPQPNFGEASCVPHVACVALLHTRCRCGLCPLPLLPRGIYCRCQRECTSAVFEYQSREDVGVLQCRPSQKHPQLPIFPGTDGPSMWDTCALRCAPHSARPHADCVVRVSLSVAAPCDVSDRRWWSPSPLSETTQHNVSQISPYKR